LDIKIALVYLEDRGDFRVFVVCLEELKKSSFARFAMAALIQNGLLDRYAERAALIVFCAANITHCLEKRGKPASIEVVDPEKAEKYIILAKSVNNIKLWEKYYALKEVTLDIGSLGTIQQRVWGYQDFLINEHKGKYRLIEGKDNLERFGDIIAASAIIRTMRARFAQDRIVDPEIRQKVARLIWQADEFNVGMSRGVNHAKKHDKDTKETLDAVYKGFQSQFDETFEPIFTESLPPLPEGTSHALAWYVG
jgi:hypothetical protein